MTFSPQLNEQISTGAGLASAGAAIHFGEQGRQARARGLELQEDAQASAEARARGQQRRQEDASRRASAQKPNIAAILANSQRFGLQGLSSTQLTGPLRSPLGGR